MYKVNHHIITLVVLFFSLATGILMGMTMGDDIMIKQQEQVIDHLEKHFVKLAEKNKL